MARSSTSFGGYYRNPRSGPSGSATQTVWNRLNQLGQPANIVDPTDYLNSVQANIKTKLNDNMNAVAGRLGPGGMVPMKPGGESSGYAQLLANEGRLANQEYGQIANKAYLDAAESAAGRGLESASMFGRLGLDFGKQMSDEEGFWASRSDQMAAEQQNKERNWQTMVERAEQMRLNRRNQGLRENQYMNAQDRGTPGSVRRNRLAWQEDSPDAGFQYFLKQLTGRAGY